MSGGILGNFFSGSSGLGLLGGMGAEASPQAPQAQGLGFLDNLHNMVQNNQGGLLNFGGALLNGDGFSGAAKGLADGQKQDFVRRQLIAKQNETLQKRTAAKAAAEKMGLPPEMANDPDTVLGLWKTVEATNRTRQPSEWQQLTAGLSSEELKRARDRKLFGDAPSQDWNVIGQDDYGNNQYGFVDKRKGSVSPYQGQPQPASTPTAEQGGPEALSLPPPPPGVNPKIWRDEQTRIAANEGKQSEKMRGDLATTRQAADGLKSELKVLKEQVKKYGAELVDGPNKAAMQTTYTNIQMRMKDLYQLGAITGPDMAILNQIIENPTASGPMDYVGKSFRREARTAAQINQIERIIDNSVKDAERNFGGRSGASQQNTGRPSRSDLAAEARRRGLR